MGAAAAKKEPSSLIVALKYKCRPWSEAAFAQVYCYETIVLSNPTELHSRQFFRF
jgi:hypothetical protein